MNDSTRFYLFWFVCIPLRILIGILATYLTFKKIEIFFIVLAVYATITSGGFAMNIIRAQKGLKKKGGFDGDIWWTNTRIIHFLNWLLCAVLSFLHVKGSGIPLLVDSLVGIVVGITHHGFKIDF